MDEFCKFMLDNYLIGSLCHCVNECIHEKICDSLIIKYFCHDVIMLDY